MSVDVTLGATQPSQRIKEGPFFAFMAALLLASAIVGFAPNSIAILVGSRPVPPLLIHIHAALMLAWLLLLVTQTTLSAAGHIRIHQRLGLVALIVVPAMVLVMIVSSYAFLTEGDVPARRYNILLLQLRSIILFPLFVSWALSARRSSPGTHKRLMIIATVVLLDAAISRTSWLPGTGPTHSDYELMSVYQLLLLAPIILYDLLSMGRVHRASIVGVGLFAISAIVVNLLWGSQWWLETSARFVKMLI